MFPALRPDPERIFLGPRPGRLVTTTLHLRFGDDESSALSRDLVVLVADTTRIFRRCSRCHPPREASCSNRAPEYSGYSVEVPFLPGCFSQGRTVEEAMRNIREAIECYLEASEPVAVTRSAGC